ncbi:major capsid protein [Campylobacter phage PC22]|nr:major capsid protein [Campylobacter phage PC22]WAK44804.1 major capsid protein [Campylobacter phage PC11]
MSRITDSELKLLNQKGFFNRYSDAQPTFTANNIGMPAGILSSLNAQIVENILNYRTGDEALGKREKLLDWKDDNYYSPIVERTGQTTPYSDYGMPLLAGMNVNFNMVGHYRFSTKFNYANLEAEQISAAKINYNDMLMSATTEAIAVELNRTAFNGYIQNSGNAFLCYGLLNNPELQNYEQATKLFSAMTWQEIMAFFAGAISKLVTQSGNNINGKSNIRCVLSATAFTTLQSKYTDLGISVYETLQKTYPNMYFVSAIEFVKAYNNQDVIYFIGESMAGGIAETTKLGYSELALMGNVVQSDYGYSQAMSAGTCGALVFKPLFVARYNNI